MIYKYMDNLKTINKEVCMKLLVAVYHYYNKCYQKKTHSDAKSHKQSISHCLI